MRLKSLLFLLPIFVFGGKEGKIFWTQDQGAFKLYRQVGALLRDTTGNVHVWSVENMMPPSWIISDLSNHYILSQIKGDNSTFVRKSDFNSAWVSISGIPGNAEVNYVDIHYNSATSSQILAATSDGVYLSTNSGSSWAAQKPSVLKGNISYVTTSPIVQSSPSTGAEKMYAVKDNFIYARTYQPWINWSQLPPLLLREGFEDSTVSSDTLPAGWTRFGTQDNYRYVTRDTSFVNTGNYSLVIHAEGMGGDDFGVSYASPDLGFLVTDFDIATGLISGKMVIKNMGKQLVMQVYGGALRVWGEYGWSSIDPAFESTPFTWNHLTVTTNFEDGVAYVTTPNVVDTVDLTAASDSLPAISFYGPGFEVSAISYYIDNFNLEPKVYAIVPEDSLKDNIYATTPLGVYYYDGTLDEWSKVYDVKGLWSIAVHNNTGTKYVVAEPTAGNTKIVEYDRTDWTDITGALADTSIEIRNIVFDDSDNVYAATNDYIYKRGPTDADWTRLSNDFTNYGVESYVRDVSCVTAYSPDTIFVGNLNGLYKSYNAGTNWVEDNNGIDDASVTLTDAVIAKVDSFFEYMTPGVPNTGLYDLVNDNLDSIPDVDGKPLNILLLDIEDLTAGGSSDWCYSYFDPTNEYVDSLHTYSNKTEIIYVDYPKFLSDPDEAVPEIAKSMAEMVGWWDDPNEEDWLQKCFNYYVYHIAAFGLGDTGIDSTGVQFMNDKALVTKDVASEGSGAENLPYLFVQYLRDNYGDSFIKSLIKAKGIFLVDPITGRKDTIPVQGIASIDTTLEQNSLSGNFVSMFEEFFPQGFMDSLKTVKSIKFLPVPVTTIDKTGATRYYGANLYKISSYYASGYASNKVVFNGGNTNDFVLYVIKTNASDSIVSVTKVDTSDFIAGNVYEIDISDLQDSTSGIDKDYVFVEVISNKGVDPLRASYVFAIDNSRDTTVEVGFIPSPLADRYLRVLLFSEKSLYKDIGLETPLLIAGSDTTLMTLSPDSPLANGKNKYVADYVLPTNTDTSGEILTIWAEDASANPYVDTMIVKTTDVSSSGTVIAGTYEVRVPAGAVSSTTKFTTISGKNECYVSASGVLNKPIVISIRKPNLKGTEKIYRFDGNNWVEVGGTIVGDRIEVSTQNLGTFKVMSSRTPTPIAPTFNLSVDRISSGRTSISFSIPVDSKVTLRIYDTSGRMIKEVVNQNLSAGNYNYRWNAMNNKGRRVASGVYFYRLTAGEKRITKKGLLVR